MTIAHSMTTAKRRLTVVLLALLLAAGIGITAPPAPAAAGQGTVSVSGQRCTADNGGYYARFYGSTDGARRASLPTYYSVEGGSWVRISNVVAGKYGIGSTDAITANWPKGAGSISVRVKIDGVIGSKSIEFNPSRCRAGGGRF